MVGTSLEYASAEEFWKYYQDRRETPSNCGEFNIVPRQLALGSGEESIAVVGGDE